jgi:hypothetical protein
VSGVIARRTQDLLRQQVIRATREAARADNVSVHADGLAFVLEPRAMFVNAPVAGLEKLDFKTILDGQPVLDDKPIMYWQLSGPAFDDENAIIPAGSYTVVADEKRGAVSLRTADGTTVAEGDLDIGVSTIIAKTSVSGKVTGFSVSLPCIKVTGTVTVKQNNHSVTVTATVEACLW